MSTTSPPPASPESADPSMEEILASIRRILNDDEVPEAAPVPVPQEDDVLVLDESMMVAPPEATSEAESPHGGAPVVVDKPLAVKDTAPENEVVEPPVLLPPPAEPLHPPSPASSPVAQAEPTEPLAPTADLIGIAAAAAAASSVGTLVRTLSANRATQVYAGGPTLEDMVRAELRPLLKDWLDAHLPPMVERLVRAEIERVVGRFVP